MKNVTHHINQLTVHAIILLAIGLMQRYIIGKRRFNRRGVAGMQYFKSHSVALVTIIIERVVNMIAALLIIGAIILYLLK